MVLTRGVLRRIDDPTLCVTTIVNDYMHRKMVQLMEDDPSLPVEAAERIVAYALVWKVTQILR